MEEFAFALVPRGGKKHKHGLEKYPIIVEEPQDEKGGLDPKDLAKNEGLWAINGQIREVLLTPAPDDCAIIAPSYMDVMIEQIKRGEGKGNPTDRKWADQIIETMCNYQFTHYSDSQYIGKGKIQTLMGEYHIDATLLESLSYRYNALEKQDSDCDHTKIPLWLEMIQINGWNVYQPGAYAPKETQKYLYKDGNNQNKHVNLSLNTVQKEIVKGQKIDVYGAYTEAKASQRTTLPVTKLEEIALEWDNGKKQVRTDRQCFWFAELAKSVFKNGDLLDECKKISDKFHMELNKHFIGITGEGQKIRETTGKRDKMAILCSFAAISLIAACDALEKKITWNTPYACLKGALIFAELIMGDAYYYMRKHLSWSVRPQHHKKVKEEEERQYVYRKINLFDPSIPVGTLIYAWNLQIHDDGEKHINTGCICSERIYEDDDDALYHWYDDKEYSALMQKLINGEIQLHHITHEQIFKKDSNIYLMNVDEDVYLDTKGTMSTPSYIDKKISVPFARATFQCSTNVVNVEGSDDIWRKRVSDLYMLDCLSSTSVAIPERTSTMWGIHGEALVKAQKGTDLYEHLKQQRKRSCRISAIRDTIRLIFRRMFSTCKYHSKAEILMSRIKDRYQPSELDVWDAEPFISQMTCVSQLVIFLFDYVFEDRRRLVDVDTSRLYHRTLTEGELMSLLKAEFPNAYRKIATCELVEDAAVINFIYLAALLHRGGRRTLEQCYFLLFGQEITLLPLESARSDFQMALSIIGFHAGLVRRRELLNDLEKVLTREVRSAIIESRAVSIGRSLSTRDSKETILTIYASSICSGLGEAVVLLRAITYPKKGLIPIVLHSENMSIDLIDKELHALLKYSKDTVVGVVRFCVHADRMTVSASGSCNAKVMSRNYMNMVHDLCVVKTSGNVLGNEELVSKLMNRRRL
nr:OC1 protein [Tibet orbivirus]